MVKDIFRNVILPQNYKSLKVQVKKVVLIVHEGKDFEFFDGGSNEIDENDVELVLSDKNEEEKVSKVEE